MMTWVVVLIEHGAVDGDGVKVFTDKDAAIENFLEVADDIQLVESDTYNLDMAMLQAWSENYAVTIFEKEI